MTSRLLGALCALSCLASPAFAHITLEAGSAPAGSTYKAVLRVPHGCAGAATVVVKVQIPEGIIAVKPMPKPGWTLTTTTAPYKQAQDYFGTSLTEGVREISWSGGKLPDAWYDEFVFRGTLAKSLPADTTVYMPVVQECEGGKADRWIEIPAAGKGSDDYRYPAPALKITKPAAGGH
jgi:uncharacterized protein YcnI